MRLFNMKEWVVSLVVIILILTVISIILPDGKMSKFTKGVFSMLITLVMLKPVFNLKNNEIIYTVVDENQSLEVQNKYLDYIYLQKATNYEQKCAQIALEYGIMVLETRIDYNVGEKYEFIIEKIVVYYEEKKDFSIVEREKVIDEIKCKICESLFVIKDKVEFYVKK